MSKYQLGLYEKATPTDLSWEERLSVAGESGFDYVEISVDESDARLSRLEWTGEERAAVRQAMVNSGVRLGSMCLSGHRKYPFGSRDQATRERSLEIMQKALDLAGDLGLHTIQLAGYDVYYEDGAEDTRKYFEENLAKAVEMAAKAGIVMGFETMETPFMDTVEKAMHYVSLINSPYLGVYPDAGNLTNASFIYGNTVADDIALGAGHIFAAHLKETVPAPLTTRELSRSLFLRVLGALLQRCGTPATRTGRKILSLLPPTFAAKLIRRLRGKRPFCTCFGFLATDGT